MSDDKEKLRKSISDEFEDFMDFLKEKTIDCDIEFFMTLCVLSDPVTLEKKLHFAPGGFASSLLFNLNVDNILGNYDRKNPVGSGTIEEVKEQFEDKFRQRINNLRIASGENKLKRSYPKLYEKYEVYNNFYKSIRDIIKMLNDPRKSPLEKLRIRSEFSKMFKEQGEEVDVDELFKKAENFSLKSFCEEYADCFTLLVDNMDEIFDYLLSHNINMKNLDIDSEKLELYIANQSMEICEKNPEVDGQRFIYYVSNYFNSDKTRKDNDSLKITIGKIEDKTVRISEKAKEGEEITPKDLYERYKKFLVDNPDIKVLDLRDVDFSGMSLEDVEMFLLEYLKDLQANWELIPPDVFAIDTIRPPRNGEGMNPIDKQKHLDRLLELYREKKEFYGSTDPFFRVKGKNTFDGYVGFLYSNGKVILDKFYEKSGTGKVADGEAIYVMDISDFYRLSHYSKRVLMQDPRVKRVVHSGDWQGRVRKIIDANTKQTRTAEEVKQLMKTNALKEE